MDNKNRRTLEEQCNSSVENTFTCSRWKPSSVSVLSEDVARGADHTLQFLKFRLDIRKKKKALGGQCNTGTSSEVSL